MRAVVQSGYGAPRRVLTLTEIEKPVPGEGEVLVAVRATSVHPDVWHVVRGLPYMLRAMGSGLFRPKVKVPGTDLAGVVDAVGPGVSRFAVGDDVFGQSVRGHEWKNGASFAEYAAVPHDALQPKPPNVSFAQAACVPTSGKIALSSLNEVGGIAPGESVLVNGGGGGVGMFMIELAKAFGARVTGVDIAEKADAMRSMGADHTIDFRDEDFTDTGVRYDLIVDIPGNRTFRDLRRALAPGGRYVFIGHENFRLWRGRFVGRAMPRFIRMAVTRPFGRSDKVDRRVDDRPALVVLAELLAAGKLTPLVDRTFGLSQAIEAIEYLETRTSGGKIVLTP